MRNVILGPVFVSRFFLRLAEARCSKKEKRDKNRRFRLLIFKRKKEKSRFFFWGTAPRRDAYFQKKKRDRVISPRFLQCFCNTRFSHIFAVVSGPLEPGKRPLRHKLL